VVGGCEEAFGEGAEAGAYLDDDVVGCEICGGDDAVEDVGVGEEVLAKGFGGGDAGFADRARLEGAVTAGALATARG
jgi:hypothetical protein